MDPNWKLVQHKQALARTQADTIAIIHRMQALARVLAAPAWQGQGVRPWAPLRATAHAAAAKQQRHEDRSEGRQHTLCASRRWSFHGWFWSSASMWLLSLAILSWALLHLCMVWLVGKTWRPVWSVWSMQRQSDVGCIASYTCATFLVNLHLVGYQIAQSCGSHDLQPCISCQEPTKKETNMNISMLTIESTYFFIRINSCSAATPFAAVRTTTTTIIEATHTVHRRIHSWTTHVGKYCPRTC